MVPEPAIGSKIAISKMLEELRTFRQSSLPPASEDVELREELLEETRMVLLALEREDNVVERVCFQVMETVAISAAVRMGMFAAFRDNLPSSTGDIAHACRADPILVGRLLRCLASFGAIQELGPGLYGHSTASQTFTKRNNEAALTFCLDFLTPAWLCLPSHLEENGWQNPISPTNTAIGKAWGSQWSNKTLFDIMGAAPPRILDAFNVYMTSFNSGHKEWTDFYPVRDRLGQDAKQDPSAVMMVDVGGGYGHQAAGLKRKFPQLPGRFIVQDLIQGLPSDKLPGVEYMEHDFFEDQPIKGARLYYLRYVIHDWPQEKNVKICTRLREAMTAGYSRLLIHEWIVPQTQPSKFMTAQDLNLMSVQAGLERTLPLHREYLEKAGLKITKVYLPGDKISEGIIEAEVA